jgi:phosphatidylinositol alpha-1,6-mannosyltransferase
MLVTVGSISPRKGQHNVLKAMPSILVQYPQAHYHMVGLDHHRSEVDKLIQLLGITQHVTVHGSLPDADKERLTASADVFLMLSENQPNGDVEGFGIAILEANAWGVPAIGAAGCGIEDAISPMSGVLVHPNDAQAVAQAVADLYEGRWNTNPAAWAAQFQWNKLVLEYDTLLT